MGLLAAGLIAFGVSRVTAPDGYSRIGEDAVGVIEPDGRISARYPVGRSPAAVVSGAGSVWVANALDGTVSRIDPEHQIAQIDVHGEPTALAFGAGALWVANGEERTVAQVDPGSNRVVGELPVGNASRGVAVGYGALWVTSAIDGLVRRIDLAHPSRRRSIDIGANPTAITAGTGAIWVASEESGTVTRLDPRTGAVAADAIHVGQGPGAVASGAGAIWTANRPDGTVSRIDPRTNAVSWTVPVGAEPSAIAADDGGVWVAGGNTGKVLRIDPHSRRVEPTDVGSSASAIAVLGGSAWASAVAPPASHRGGTLRVITWRSPRDPVPIDWLRAEAYDLESYQLISLAYDGLVAYRRTAGAAGATLVGALATDAPEPSDDGRTYVFTLRPGVEFSNGAPVRPEDFRASIERFLQASRTEFFTPYFNAIVGAARCTESAARCDLSSGIETDTRARTITIHLTHPDAEFLHKLTFSFAYVVPASTPRRAIGDDAPPGTGPYRFATWSARRGGTLLRNPRFRSSSPQERPAGFADRVEVEVRSMGSRAQQKLGTAVEQVRRGSADVTTVANAFGSVLPAHRIQALAIRAPGLMHTFPEAVLNHMFLNVQRPPFDDQRVRQALNFATDRARVVQLEGGSPLATATCQILPRGFPGHRPYCPYTAHAGEGRAWSAPDVERARALVARSGTAGERVVVTVPEFQRDIGRYFTGLLGRLGYRASLRVLGDSYFDVIFDPKSSVQFGFNGWSQDYASPSTFIEPNFGCRDVLSRLCDRRLMRQVARARSAEGADARARWAAIDRRVTDLAPAIPLTNRRSVDIVSPRVGNVQHHVTGYTLLEQLWVQ